MKSAKEWMELGKKNPERDNPDLERQTQYVLTSKWILDVKQRITRLQSAAPEKPGNKEDPKQTPNIKEPYISLNNTIFPFDINCKGR